MRWILRSKIQYTTVAEANLDNIRSITVDKTLVEQVGVRPGEKMLVVSNYSGERMETYVIIGERV